MINYEIKSQLAKLLATEDLVVENRDVDTAQFDVHTRVLTLPLWEKASHDVYDSLVAHEVGHALFTPDVDWSLDLKVPQQFVNVVEDARVEKLMKRKYPGLAKSFYRGYNELHDDDFFELDGEDITSFNLADRANLYFKVGHFLDLAFLPAEKEIIDMIGRCETFDDTKKAAFVLYQYCLEQQKKEQEEKVKNHEQAKMFYDECMENAGIEEYPSLEEDPEEELSVKTDKALNENIQTLSEGVRNYLENVYCTIPEVNLDTVIVSNIKVQKELEEHFEIELLDKPDSLVWVDNKYISFKRSAQKEVNYLVKEFECRKSADAYARTSTAKTGVLDCSKLHTYKFDEDIFKKVNVVPDGKNHGLIFILDWSGSMSDCLVDTIKQLYNLVWFCQKVQIPFEVYAFTNNYNRWDSLPEGVPCPPAHVKKRENDLVFSDDFILLNFLSSEVSKLKLEQQLLNLWRLSYCHSKDNWVEYVSPGKYHLSGTPLNEALITLHKIIPSFKKKHNLQKVQCIILTDGEANALPVYRSFESEWNPLHKDFRCRNLKVGYSYLRNKKTGYVYPFPYNYWGFTEVLLKDLKQTYFDTNFIGIRVVPSRDFNTFIKRHDILTDAQLIKVKKDKTYSIKNSGYQSYFAIISSALSQDAGFEVEEDATKAQIKRAFVKSLNTKKLNKKVLGEFIELVS